MMDMEQDPSDGIRSNGVKWAQGEPLMDNGLTRAETDESASVAGLAAQGEPVALPSDLLTYMMCHITQERVALAGFLSIGNEVSRAAKYDRWIAALAAAPKAAPQPDCTDPMCACRGGPCVACADGEREKEIGDLRDSLAFYKRRTDALQKAQSQMRDPERTMVCDILANGTLLTPAFDRYAAPKAAPPEPSDPPVTVCLAGRWYEYPAPKAAPADTLTDDQIAQIAVEVVDNLPPEDDEAPTEWVFSDAGLAAVVRECIKRAHGIPEQGKGG